jgi:hypothetical protein
LQEQLDDEDFRDLLKRSTSVEGSSSNKDLANGSIHRRESQRSNKVNEEPAKEEEEEADKLIEAEDAAEGSVGMDVYLRYFKSVGWFLITIITFFGLSSETSNVLSNCKQF